MNIWNNYITSVRTKIQVKQDKKLLTERQWKLKHFVKINDKCGKYLWINAYCPSKELYLWDEEVRHMTEQELAKYRADEKSKRIAQRKALLKRKEAKKQEELQLFKKEITQNIIKKTFSVPYKSEIIYDEIVIDTETTGLNPYDDELLQVSIIDGQGNTLFNSYIKPLYTDNWNKAMAVNHITPETVATAPNILEVKQEISRIINSAHTIIGYNVDFDLGFLSNIGIKNENAAIVDVMENFAYIYGEWSEQYGCHKWQRLTKCAEYYGYDWGTDIAHDSLADCKATLYCYQKMLQEKHM
jgi:DNA polymerase-3 subunit epsilon